MSRQSWSIINRTIGNLIKYNLIQNSVKLQEHHLPFSFNLNPIQIFIIIIIFKLFFWDLFLNIFMEISSLITRFSIIKPRNILTTFIVLFISFWTKFYAFFVCLILYFEFFLIRFSLLRKFLQFVFLCQERRYFGDVTGVAGTSGCQT